MAKIPSPTINDVARLAGVSKATVSNVINRKGNVRQTTYDKVMQTCAELNYSPSFAASNLAKRDTGVFGLFLYDREDTFESNVCHNLMEGLILASAKQNMQMMVYYGVDRHQMHQAISGKGPIDGAIILRPVQNDFRIHELSQNAIETVLVGSPFRGENALRYVDVDNARMMYEITTRLVEMGKRQFLFFNSRADYSVSQDRSIGFYRALADLGVDANQSIVVNMMNKDDAMTGVVESFLRTHAGEVAILTVAASACTMLRACPIVREKHAMLFDFERLTVDYKRMGESAFRLLHSALMGQEEPRREIVPYVINYDGLRNE